MQRLFTEFDKFLNTKQLIRKHVAKDSSCLFRCFSEIVYKSQLLHSNVKQDLLKYVCDYKEQIKPQSFQNSDYLDKLRADDYFGRKIDVELLSKIYGKTTVIWTNEEKEETIFRSNDDGEPVILAYDEDKSQFDIVYTEDYMQLLTVCQSCVYEVVYVNVVGYDGSFLQQITQMMLEEKHFVRLKKQGKALRKVSRDADAHCNSHEYNESELPPISYKVAKCLSFKVYRNEAFDIWASRHKDYLMQILRTPPLSLGAMCLVNVDSSDCVAYVQQIADKMVEVYILEKTEKIWIPKHELKVVPFPRKEKQWIRSRRGETCRHIPLSSVSSSRTLDSDIPSQMYGSSYSQTASMRPASFYVTSPTFNIHNANYIHVYPTVASAGDVFSSPPCDANDSMTSMSFWPQCNAFFGGVGDDSRNYLQPCCGHQTYMQRNEYNFI